MSRPYSQHSPLGRLGRFRYDPRFGTKKPNGQPILQCTQYGSTEFEVGFAPEALQLVTSDSNPESSCKFICSICKGIPRYPTELRKCGHLFCSFCIHHTLRQRGNIGIATVSAACPMCKRQFTLGDICEIESSSRFLFRLYTELDIRCTHGCSHTCSPPAMLEHETWQCRRRRVRCPNSACNHESSDEDMERHLETCQQRIVYCTGCRLPKRVSDVTHDCIRALSDTITLLVVDRVSNELLIEKIFGDPVSTHFGEVNDIGLRRIEDEQNARTALETGQPVHIEHEDVAVGTPTIQEPARGFDEVD